MIKTKQDAYDWCRLIDSARNGCDLALGEIANRTHAYLLVIAGNGLSQNLRPKFGASDVVQNSLLDAKRSMSGFSGTTEGELRSWLKQIVMHNLIDNARRFTHAKSRRVGQEVSLESLGPQVPFAATPTASAAICLRESDEQLSIAVSRLPFRQRSVVEARFKFGRSYQEIAQQMQLSEGAVRKLWHRATVQLRHWLSEHDG